MSNQSIRIDSLLSQRGYCARRKVQDFLIKHRVTVDGVLIKESGFRVENGMKILIDGRKICLPVSKIYIALNKPEGYLCSMSDAYGRKLAVDLIPEAKKQRIYNAGRLDYDSCGLVLFTNDGEWAYYLTHPKYEVEKEYEVYTDRPASKEIMELMQKGIFDKNENLKIECYELSTNSPYTKVTLKEGKNREIRRLFAYFGIKVKILRRLRIGNILLGKLADGERRILKQEEVESFRKRC